MKGIILAGGKGTRLYPCTKVTNKHLLPVFDRPMIYYPMNKIKEAGINEILLVSGSEHAGHFLEILGDGSEFGLKIEYAVQSQAGGIAQALSLAEEFSAGENVAVILGDNIFSDSFKTEVDNFSDGGQVFLKEVDDARRFGVADLDENKNVISIEEKPENPKTNLAVTGFYLYDNSVFDKIKKLKPSLRGELEITDVNLDYLKEGKLKASILGGEWTDAGTFESLHKAAKLVQERKIENPF